MFNRAKKLQARFYALPSGRKPVRDWILELGKDDRVMFCIVKSELVLLHGFVKKSQKAPAKDIELARRRQREIM